MFLPYFYSYTQNIQIISIKYCTPVLKPIVKHVRENLGFDVSNQERICHRSPWSPESDSGVTHIYWHQKRLCRKPVIRYLCGRSFSSDDDDNNASSSYPVDHVFRRYRHEKNIFFFLRGSPRWHVAAGVTCATCVRPVIVHQSSSCQNCDLYLYECRKIFGPLCAVCVSDETFWICHRSYSLVLSRISVDCVIYVVLMSRQIGIEIRFMSVFPWF